MPKVFIIKIVNLCIRRAARGKWLFQASHFIEFGNYRLSMDGS